MITIEYCGYHTHNPDRDLIFRPSGSSSYLFLLVLSPMRFTFQEKQEPVRAEPGACILYTPGVYQHYQAEKVFFNSYVHFFCEEDELAPYQLICNRLFYPESTDNLNWLIKNIYHESINRFDCSSLMIHHYVHQLLIELHRSRQSLGSRTDRQQNIYPELLSLRSHMLQNCSQPWSVEQLCGILNIGKSQFYRYYEMYFHSSPKEELLQARLQKARYLLTNDAMTVKQAAYMAGFQNICYFNRVFKKVCGCSPGEYRKNAAGKQTT